MHLCILSMASPQPSMAHHLPRLNANAVFPSTPTLYPYSQNSPIFLTLTPTKANTQLTMFCQPVWSWLCLVQCLLPIRVHILILNSLNQDHTAGTSLETINWDSCHGNTVCRCHPDSFPRLCSIFAAMSLLEGPKSGQVWSYTHPGISLRIRG